MQDGYFAATVDKIKYEIYKTTFKKRDSNINTFDEDMKFCTNVTVLQFNK